MSTVSPLFSSVTRTRVIVPRRRSQLLSRQRLIDLFYDLLDYKLILVSAPAGYGKSSFLVDVAHHTELPVCWYTIDPLDDDPQRFITHFIAAIAHRFPTFGQQSITFLNNITLDSEGLDRLITTIVNEAYERIREQFIIVIDDYHLLTHQTIGQFVNRFIQQIDDNCNLVLASRHRVNLPDLILMAGRAQVKEIEISDLIFQVDEIQALASQHYNRFISKAEAEELAAESEGWITGLLLSAQIKQQDMAGQLRLARVLDVDAYSYLAQQVFEQQSPLIQDFLLRTSLLEEFDADLCQSVLGSIEAHYSKDWAELIQIAVQNNLFVQPIDDQATWLRYHHLFQTFLQEQMQAKDPDEAAAILRRLAAEYMKREAWEKAHSLYRQLGDIEALAGLIQRAGLSLAHGGRFTILSRWIDDLPARLLKSHPVLLSLRGYAATLLGEMRQGLELLNQAETVIRANGDLTNLTRTLVWRSGVNRLLGHYEQALADAEEAFVIAMEDHSLQTEALRAKGQALLQIGRQNEAFECLRQSLALATSLEDIQNVTRLSLELGVAYMNAGRYEQALIYFKRARERWQADNNITRQANLLNNLGVLYHQTGDYSQAASAFDEALSYAQQSANVRMEAFILCGMGDLYTDLDVLDFAGTAYGKARKIARQVDNSFLLLYLDLAEAALARVQNDLVRAHTLLASAKQRVQKSNSEVEERLYQLEASQLSIVEGNISQAIANLEPVAAYFAQNDKQIEGVRAYLQLAIAYQKIDKKQHTLHHLQQAFDLASGLESQHPVVVTARYSQKLIEMAQADLIVGVQATQLFKQIVQFEKKIPRLRRKLRQQTPILFPVPPKLSIRTLGKTRLALDGQPVTHAEWQTQRRVRELFFYLLAHPDGLNRELIGLTFWPNSSIAQLKQQFKNTIYKLRRALDKDVIEFDAEDALYYFNWHMDYEYDVDKFQTAISQAQAETIPEAQIAAYKTAAGIYQGTYLPDLDGTWVWEKRESLQQSFITAATHLTRYYMETGDYDLVLNYCHQALTQDPSYEKFHRQAMRAHAALGNRAAVVRQFEQCQQILQEEVNVPISPQTKTLYETLIRG